MNPHPEFSPAETEGHSDRVTKHHVISSKSLHAEDVRTFTRKAKRSVVEMIHQTTPAEKSILLVCGIAIFLCFRPWATSNDIQITGLSHFMAVIGYLTIVVSGYVITTIIASFYDKDLVGFWGTHAKARIVCGSTIALLGLIAYSILSSFISLSTLITRVDTNLIFIMLCGVVVLALGVYELAYEQTKKSKTIVTEHLKPDADTHELHDILKSKRQK